VPGAEWTATHSDAWGLTAVPRSLLVVGGGMTGLQVASIFQAFGSRVSLYQSGPRLLAAEDQDVSTAVTAALRASGMDVRENCGRIESFEHVPGGIRMHLSPDGKAESADAELVVVAIGWTADTAGLDLEAAGVATDEKGFVRIDEYLATSAPHVFAAGDVTGRFMVVPPALHDGYVAATNAVRGEVLRRETGLNPTGSFTDPEYASVGLTEADARTRHDVVVGRVSFDETTRTIIDGRTNGFCKVLADRASGEIVGCHVVGERAVDIVQVVTIAMASGMKVDDLARVALSYPTYAGILARAAYRAALQIDPALVAPRQLGQE
jgi:pyruvate/2-oxoglutarate dehydrogenase complex dihydrolipoamide dehydrogenase (E3) component